MSMLLLAIIMLTWKYNLVRTLENSLGMILY